ncbi:MAG: IS21 family transposase [Gemmatimonadota bacterium]|nr:IS21 family transposase [Gemmatimonadota bacterium]
MWEILEVLRRVARGERQRAIQRVTGHSRSSVRRWVRAARRLGWEPGAAEPDEALARAVAQRLRPVRDEPELGQSEARLRPHRERIEAWLRPEDGGRGLRLAKVHALLGREGIRVPYSSLHRFATQHCGFQDRRRLTVRVAEVAPGELAEVDFGRLGLVWDPASERRRVLHALIVTLVHSRHQYVHVTHTQKLPDLIEGLEDAWAFFGGVPARVVLDNLKAAVTKSDRYEPTFQRTFAEYARHRGFVIDAAVPRHAKGKPHVERGVQYLRESFFRGETWLDRDHVQREAVRWCRAVAGPRLHGTTRQRPLAVFENVEKPALRPLERARFDPPTWARCKVHPDHHIQFQKAIYSVPTRHVGKSVWVRGDSKLIRVFVDGTCIKTHGRVAEGCRSTDYHDYPPERAPYAMRDPESVIREARRRGEHVGRFAEKLLAGTFPWAKLRQAQKLLRLGHKYGFPRLDAACRRALAFDLVNTKRLERIVVHGPEPLGDPEAPGQLVLLPTRFLRPADHFTHTKENETHGHRDQPIAQDRPQAPEALGRPGDTPRPPRLHPEDEAS